VLNNGLDYSSCVSFVYFLVFEVTKGTGGTVSHHKGTEALSYTEFFYIQGHGGHRASFFGLRGTKVTEARWKKELLVALVCYSSDAILYERRIEVDKQSQSLVG
jgi:hypothetical protein